MPSWPTALVGMFGAGYAATQAQKYGIDAPSVLVNTALKGLGDPSGFAASSSGRNSGGSSELTVLQGEVDRLHRLLSDVVRGQKGGSTGVHVIHTGRGGWSVLILPAAVVGGGFYLYVRFRGLSIADFFMVTNKSLQNFREVVTNSFSKMWDEMRKQKDEFMARIGAVGEQQQQMMAKQSEMDDRLRHVSDNVEDIRDSANSIEARVGQMDQNMSIMSAGVQRANEGIYLLCAAVADVTRRIGMDNSKLRMYVQATPAELTDASPGLRSLLEGIGGSPDATPALSASASVTEVILEEPADMGSGGILGLDPALAAVPTRNRQFNSLTSSGSGDVSSVMYRAPSAANSGRGFVSMFGSMSANRTRANSVPAVVVGQ